MFRSLRLKLQPEKVVTDPGSLPGQWLAENVHLPITLAQINRLPGNTKRRIYRNLIPPSLLARFEIDPITWKGPQGDGHVLLKAEEGKGVTWVLLRIPPDESGDFFYLEIAVMEIRVNERKPVNVVTITGSIDALTSGDFSSFMSGLIQKGQSQLVVDLSQVDYMSSAGLAGTCAWQPPGLRLKRF
jgi:STAS domain